MDGMGGCSVPAEFASPGGYSCAGRRGSRTTLVNQKRKREEKLGEHFQEPNVSKIRVGRQSHVLQPKVEGTHV